MTINEFGKTLIKNHPVEFKLFFAIINRNPPVKGWKAIKNYRRILNKIHYQLDR